MVNSQCFILRRREGMNPSPLMLHKVSAQTLCDHEENFKEKVERL